MPNPYEERLKRVKRLLKHAQTPCSDPDCEIHHPWVQEDEAERIYAMAYYIAGAQGYAHYLYNHTDEFLSNIRDEMNAPTHP